MKYIDFPLVWEHFIVFEGLDGAGTTTQVNLLSDYFKNSGINFYKTCQPSSKAISPLIRKILKGEFAAQPKTIAYLFAADRHEHIYGTTNGLSAIHKTGAWILSDRYLFSSLAYQSIENDFDFILSLNNSFPLPCFLFFIDVPPAICFERLSVRGGQREIYETINFQEKVFSVYEKTLSYYKDSPVKIIRLNGTAAPSDIQKEVIKHLSPFL